MKEKITAYLAEHKDEMVEDIFRLVRIRSDRGEPEEGAPFGAGPAKALAEAVKMVKEKGFPVKNYDNCVMAVDLGGTEPGLDILAHLDVVGAGDGWDTDPYQLVRDGDLIYGRGTDDDKGPLVAAMLAMRCVRELELPLTKNVKLIMGTDEETGSRDIEHYYASHPFAPYSLSPDADFPVINIEKAGYGPKFSKTWEKTQGSGVKVLSLEGGIRKNVAPANSKAVISGGDPAQVQEVLAQVSRETGVQLTAKAEGETLAVTAVGVQAHASTPDEGKNAITATLEALCRLDLAQGEAETTVRRLHSCFPYGDNRGKALGIAMEDEASGVLTLTLSLLTLTQTGFTAIFDSRDPLCATKENTVDVVERKFAAYGWSCEGSLRPAHAVDADSDFIRTLLSAYETYSGKKGYCEAIGGGTYVHEIPGGVAFGAGDHGFDSHLHGANERARLSRLLMTAKIYALVISRLCA